MVYWDGSASYFAFGVGAASLLGGRRFSRPRTLHAYEAWAQRFHAKASGDPGK